MHLAPVICALLALPATATPQEWARFRGPAGQGIAAAADLPAVFERDHVVWRVPTGGKGHSSPVLWGDRLFLTRETAEPGERQVVCFDARDGEEIWQHTNSFVPYPKHALNSFASATPAVTAGAVYVVWPSGSELRALALDHHGALLWQETLGPTAAQHGVATSPIVHGDLLIVANDCDAADTDSDTSSLIALERETGATRWQHRRRHPSEVAAYTCPALVVPAGGPTYLLFASTADGLTAIEPESGDTLWQLDLAFHNRFIATPAIAGPYALVSAGAGAAGRECAIVILPTPDTQPTITSRPRRNLPYVPSTLALDNQFYTFSDGGITQCLDAATGTPLWRNRLDGSFFSSPVTNGEFIYIASREGQLLTLATGPEFELLGTFDLGAPVFATPAIANGHLFIRTAEHLICMGIP